MKFLLTGSSRIGKSTILQKLTEVAHGSYWVLSERILDDAGATTGYRVTSSDKSVGNFTETSDAAAIDNLYSTPIKKAVEQGYTVIIIDEIGPVQHRSPQFTAAIDQALASDATVLVTIAPDQEWTATYAQLPSVIPLTLTEENRDELTGALEAFLSSQRMIRSLPPETQSALERLSRKYITEGHISSFRKLFQNTIMYLAETRYQTSSIGSYTVKGLTRQHVVVVSGGNWMCDCDLANGRGKYEGHPAECSHIQTIKISQKLV